VELGNAFGNLDLIFAFVLSGFDLFFSFGWIKVLDKFFNCIDHLSCGCEKLSMCPEFILTPLKQVNLRAPLIPLFFGHIFKETCPCVSSTLFFNTLLSNFALFFPLLVRLLVNYRLAVVEVCFYLGKGFSLFAKPWMS